MIVNFETSTADIPWSAVAPSKGTAEFCVQTSHCSQSDADFAVSEKPSLSSHLAVLAAKLIEARRGLTEICVWLSLPLASLLDLVVMLGLPTPHDRPRRQYHAARFWTDDQISLLLKLWLADITIDDLVLRIGRPRKSVLAKARQFRLLVRERAALQAKAAASAQAMLPLLLPVSTMVQAQPKSSSSAAKCAAGHAESCSSAKNSVQPAQAGAAFTLSGGLLVSLNDVKAVAEAADREVITAPATVFALTDQQSNTSTDQQTDISAVLPLAKPHRPRIFWDPYRPQILRGVDRGLSTVALGRMLDVPHVLVEKVKWRMSIPSRVPFIAGGKFWEGLFDDSPYRNVLDHIGYRSETCCLCSKLFCSQFRSELGKRLVIKKCRHCDWTEKTRIDKRAQRAEYRRPSGSALRTIPEATDQWMQPFMIPPSRTPQPRMGAAS